ncbi:MAG: carboxypeptidase-like regulatory domain-containing protein [Planctomycetota bacterium]|nr:carboxypeptidase-like regulatory domain-containing protein [Planctomycetota bacterium]
MSRLSVAIILLAAFGCGEKYGKPVEVTGKVTKGGKAVEKARVEFHAASSELPAEHRTRFTTTDPQGLYKLDQVYPADYEVRVEMIGGGDVDPERATAAGGGNAPNDKGELTTPWTVKVTGEKKSFDFDLDKPESGK